MALQRADHEIARSAMTAISGLRAQFADAGGADDAGPATAEVPDALFTRLAGLPALLRTSGLLPTLAFYAAKGGGGGPLERAYSEVGTALRDQIRQVLELPAPAAHGRPPLDLAFLTELTDRLRERPHDLIRATRRLEEFTAWLRRLAEALKKEQTARTENGAVKNGPARQQPAGPASGGDPGSGSQRAGSGHGGEPASA